MNNELDLKKLCDELNNKCAQLEEEVISYRQNLCPKYLLKNPLFVVFVNGKQFEIAKIVPDEVIINVFGVHYREYTNETAFKQYPESLCFKTKEDAENFIEEQKKANN